MFSLMLRNGRAGRRLAVATTVGAHQAREAYESLLT